jgi:hypothetical protein
MSAVCWRVDAAIGTTLIGPAAHAHKTAEALAPTQAAKLPTHLE